MFRTRISYLAGLVLLLGANFVQAAITNPQRKELNEIGALVAEAGKAFVEKKYNDAGTAITKAQEKMTALAAGGEREVLDALEPIYGRILKAHALLELEGVFLTPLPKLSEMVTAIKPAPEPNVPNQPAPLPAKPAGGVSFVSQIAPILVAKCGRCHVQQKKGDFSLASYSAFNSAPAANVMLEKIESGEMPPGGAKVTGEELALIKQWWNAGTKFDGPDASVGLADLKPGGTQPTSTTTAPPTMQATGTETVSFSADVAPVLAEHCVGCHGAERPRENFSVLNYERLLAGGDAGAPITPGKPNDSLLIMKLEGKAEGAQMPMNKPPLATAVIAKIRKWIEEGAKFDGPDTKMDVTRVAALAKANNSTGDQLSADRAKLADEQWRLVMPGIEADKAESPHFLVYGNLGPNTLKEYADTAESLVPKIAEMFKAPAGAPLVKGRMTLFAFRIRYDYSEFGKMVERRDIPPDSRGHWNFAVVEAYGAFVAPAKDDYTVNALVGQQIAGMYVASLGKMTPRWFAEGSGRVAAGKLEPKDPRVVYWDEALPGIVGSMKASDGFLTGKIGGEEADIAAYSFVKYLMKDTRRFGMLMDGLRKGNDFTQVFSATYGGSPNQVCDLWYRKGGK